MAKFGLFKPVHNFTEVWTGKADGETGWEVKVSPSTRYGEYKNWYPHYGPPEQGKLRFNNQRELMAFTGPVPMRMPLVRALRFLGYVVDERHYLCIAAVGCTFDSGHDYEEKTKWDCWLS